MVAAVWLTPLKDARPASLDPWGVHKQWRVYTCGPAAGATALAAFGIIAKEQELASRAYTTPYWGTTLDRLRHAIEQGDASGEAQAELVAYASLSDLEDPGNDVDVIRVSIAAYADYVTVLGYDPVNDRFMVGDPSLGLRTIAENLNNIWSRTGIRVDNPARVESAPAEPLPRVSTPVASRFAENQDTKQGQ